MDEKQKRQRPMVNAATVEKCKNLKFLGYFLNATGAKREDLTAHMGITAAAFGRWFSVDDIRYSSLVRIYDYFGYDVKMVFTYADDKAPSRATAYAILNMLDPSKKLNPLFVEMKLNNFNFETIGAKLSRTAQAVNHWFLEDEIAVSMLFKFANALGATLELVPEVKGEELITQSMIVIKHNQTIPIYKLTF